MRYEDFKCLKCGEVVEDVEVNKINTITCPKCGEVMKKIIGPKHFRFVYDHSKPEERKENQ